MEVQSLHFNRVCRHSTGTTHAGFRLEFYLPDGLLPEKVGDDSRFSCDFLIEVLGNLIDQQARDLGVQLEAVGSLCFFFPDINPS